MVRRQRKVQLMADQPNTCSRQEQWRLCTTEADMSDPKELRTNKWQACNAEGQAHGHRELEGRPFSLVVSGPKGAQALCPSKG